MKEKTTIYNDAHNCLIVVCLDLPHCIASGPIMHVVRTIRMQDGSNFSLRNFIYSSVTSLLLCPVDAILKQKHSSQKENKINRRLRFDMFTTSSSGPQMMYKTLF
jgi:hypothetical protein